MSDEAQKRMSEEIPVPGDNEELTADLRIRQMAAPSEFASLKTIVDELRDTNKTLSAIYDMLDTIDATLCEKLDIINSKKEVRKMAKKKKTGKKKC